MANTKKKNAVLSEGAVRVTDTERRRELARHYKEEELKPVTISPLYKPHFGNCMMVTINGIGLAIPCDGKVYNIPKTFANEVQARIGKIDMILEKRNRMKDISKNHETTPGELNFFS